MSDSYKSKIQYIVGAVDSDKAKVGPGVPKVPFGVVITKKPAKVEDKPKKKSKKEDKDEK